MPIRNLYMSSTSQYPHVKLTIASIPRRQLFTSRFVKLTCHPVQLCLTDEQNTDAVHRTLISVVQSFLIKHGFKTQPTSGRVGDDKGPMRKKRKLEPSLSTPNLDSGGTSRRGRATAPLRRTQSQLQSQHNAPVIVPPVRLAYPTAPLLLVSN